MPKRRALRGALRLGSDGLARSADGGPVRHGGPGGHEARRITGEEIPVWDLFFTMSKTHGYILEQAGVPAQKIYIPSYIEDPFGQDLEAYRVCRDKLREELKIFFQECVQKLLPFEQDAS